MGTLEASLYNSIQNFKFQGPYNYQYKSIGNLKIKCTMKISTKGNQMFPFGNTGHILYWINAKKQIFYQTSSFYRSMMSYNNQSYYQIVMISIKTVLLPLTMQSLIALDTPLPRISFANAATSLSSLIYNKVHSIMSDFLCGMCLNG